MQFTPVATPVAPSGEEQRRCYGSGPVNTAWNKAKSSKSSSPSPSASKKGSLATRNPMLVSSVGGAIFITVIRP